MDNAFVVAMLSGLGEHPRCHTLGLRDRDSHFQRIVMKIGTDDSLLESPRDPDKGAVVRVERN